jgi:lysozyme
MSNDGPIVPAALEIIKRNEGLRLDAYPDPATGGDPWTIGYGHTGDDVSPGLSIDQARADELLQQDLDKFVDGVNDRLTLDATPNQFGAMVSLSYNIGLGNFGKSSVLRLHNAGEYTDAADAFLLWNKAAGRVFAGLTRRREEERELYLTP